MVNPEILGNKSDEYVKEIKVFQFQDRLVLCTRRSWEVEPLEYISRLKETDLTVEQFFRSRKKKMMSENFWCCNCATGFVRSFSRFYCEKCGSSWISPVERVKTIAEEMEWGNVVFFKAWVNDKEMDREDEEDFEDDEDYGEGYDDDF